MRKFLKNQKGVTMVEVLVTVAMLAIVVAPCLSSFVMAQRGNVKAAETKAAYTAAANLMEELKGLDTVDEVEDRLLGEVEINAQDGIYAIYHLVDNKYYEIWIYAGEGENESKTEDETVPDGYIVKGVIAP